MIFLCLDFLQNFNSNFLIKIAVGKQHAAKISFTYLHNFAPYQSYHCFDTVDWNSGMASAI